MDIEVMDLQTAFAAGFQRVDLPLAEEADTGQGGLFGQGLERIAVDDALHPEAIAELVRNQHGIPRL